MIFFLQPILIRTALQVFSCEEINGVQYLAQDMSQRCNTTSHEKAEIAAVIILVLYCGLLPLILFLVLLKNRKNLGNSLLAQRMSFLWNGYEPDRFFWEFVVICEKTFIVVIVVFLKDYPLMEICAGLIILLAVLLGTVYAKPFMSPSLNRLCVLAICGQFATLISAIIYFQFSTSADNSPGILLLDSITIIFNVCVILVISGYIASGYVRNISKRWSKVVARPISDDHNEQISLDEVPQT